MGKSTPEKTERNTKIFELKEQGLTFEALKKQFRLSATGVKAIYYRELKRRGLKPKRKR